MIDRQWAVETTDSIKDVDGGGLARHCSQTGKQTVGYLYTLVLDEELVSGTNDKVATSQPH